ncbi:MAG: FAD-dependent oxidoreductase [Pseudomonadales bacterium]
MTRAQIADPDLVKKLQEGQAHRIRLCTGANQGCIDRTGAFPITCIQNPEVGEERRFQALAAAVVQPKKVLVVGGGPAGIKAAEIAARRGHAVTLVEAGQHLGGRLRLVEPMGAASNLMAAVSWIEQELSLLKVRIETGLMVDEAFVRDMAPDAIIMATGARPVSSLELSSDGSVPVLSSDDAAAGMFEGQRFDMAGTRAVIVDRRANYESGMVIHEVARRGCQVTVVTPFATFGANTGMTHLVWYQRELPKLGTRFLTGSVPVRVGNGQVVVMQGLTGEELAIDCDFMVACVHPRPATDLREMLSRHAPVKAVGDVVAPRSALEAFREGDRAGRTV